MPAITATELAHEIGSGIDAWVAVEVEIGEDGDVARGTDLERIDSGQDDGHAVPYVNRVEGVLCNVVAYRVAQSIHVGCVDKVSRTAGAVTVKPVRSRPIGCRR